MRKILRCWGWGERSTLKAVQNILVLSHFFNKLVKLFKESVIPA